MKGVNLDAGWHHGINTVGQSLRNANLSLQPPNPQVPVSLINTTIGPDLDRNPIFDTDSCVGNTYNNNNNNNVPNGNVANSNANGLVAQQA